MKSCGYSFWGYLGDIKFDKEYNVVSTPDGNAFYSWSIISELQRRGYKVVQMMLDRDAIGYDLLGDELFSSWVTSKRAQAYIETEKINFYRDTINYFKIYAKEHGENYLTCIELIKSRILTRFEAYKNLKFILHEYRMLIPGRNDYESVFKDDWQPDYLIQECIFDFCIKYHKRLILFDLDYKLDYDVCRDLRSKGCPVIVFELGTKWFRTFECTGEDVEARKVYIPFDFDNIDFFILPPDIKYRYQNLVYIGNRYERDWCIDKYIPEDIDRCMIYGNWLEGGRDSAKRWSKLNFGERLQTADMYNVYQRSVATILLAKREYCNYGFMTARILESIFYGTVPLFIEEYGKTIISDFAGKYAEYLTVSSKDDVKQRVMELRKKANGRWINVIIKYLRDYLKFMDVKNFVDTIEGVL